MDSKTTTKIQSLGDLISLPGLTSLVVRLQKSCRVMHLANANSSSSRFNTLRRCQTVYHEMDLFNQNIGICYYLLSFLTMVITVLLLLTQGLCAQWTLEEIKFSNKCRDDHGASQECMRAEVTWILHETDTSRYLPNLRAIYSTRSMELHMTSHTKSVKTKTLCKEDHKRDQRT